eukprot:1157542-Alexandrium_andersonii.AAC.1
MSALARSCHFGRARSMQSVAGKLQYRHATGAVAWTPIEVIYYETEWARRRSLEATAPGAQATQPPPPPTQQPAPPAPGAPP